MPGWGSRWCQPSHNTAPVAVAGRNDRFPLVSTLRELRGALRAGGRLVVVGCYHDAGALDLALATVSLLANPVFGLVRHPRRAHGPPEHMRAPTAKAVHTFKEIVAAVERELPGAHVRRCLFWRYTLVYDTP